MLQGWVSTYTAMELEGVVWLVFQDARYATGREHDWRFEGMHQLGIGDQLTIFDNNGAVLWSGVIAPRRVGILGLRKLNPDHYEWSPEGISRETWMGWLSQHPSLAATYQPATEAKSQ